MDYIIFDHFYNEINEDSFLTLEGAIQYALDDLPSDDYPYMIGYSDERGIEAFVFQGNEYRLA